MKPDDIPEVIWEEALSLHRGCAMDPRRSAAIPIARAILQARSQAYEELRDPTEEMIVAGIGVDLGNEDERSAVINLWHSMISRAIRQHSQKGEDVNE